MRKESKGSRISDWTFIPSSWLPQIKYSDVSKESPLSDIRKERPTSSLSSSTNILPVPKTLRQDTYEDGREWIRGALLCTCAAGAILSLNIILTVIATALGLSKHGGSFQAINVYEGSCPMASNWATGLHALINVLSTFLLAASNYVMQCLGAPSRADVDRAHRKRRWLDIGTFSVRNLSVLNNKQRILWGLLLVTSTPIHMVYNSVIYSTVSALDYAILLVPDDLASNEPLAAADDNFERGFFNTVGTSAADIQTEMFNGTYRDVEAQECLDAYNTEFNSDLGTLIAVTNRHFFHNTTVLKARIDSGLFSGTMDTPSWAANITFKHGKDPIYPNQLGIGGDPIASLSFPEIPVSRCMIKQRRSLCQLTYSPAIAVVVIVSNMIKVVCMYLTARTSRTHLLLTVGDAISSFLAKPDQVTQGQRNTMRPSDGSRSSSIVPGPGQQEDQYFVPGGRKKWYRAVSTKRWMMALTFFAFCALLSVVLFLLAFRLVGSLSAAWDLGFGKFNGNNKITSPGIRENTLSLVLLTNTPQLALSILYFLFNGILTSMLAAAEFNNYAVRRRPLRVSWPKGEQRSTYYLSLPYRYSVPLISISAALHWLLSQSIFFVNIVAYDVHDEPVVGESVRGCGYSPFPMFIILLTSGILFIIFYILSTRWFKSPMPLAAEKSASISAACHPPPDDCDAALKPVMWGYKVWQDECDVDSLSTSSRTGLSETLHTCYTFTSKEVVAC
ncbi:hypothetical protein P168DRAFT_261947 [Aspergillus campestris IBT 28561]|uniref:DUF6536 domain-containing protein n=1 Tax=Aspergillus campestris (strain IBT 28561) TaxID=1392248 RepID=A0A2I1DDJ1_ASPC2|nr:uncharacterized protein P168DRAFT_261947 [Aspergillus campestris IBT 28561]PKY07921.1 hypothetical protein P168DRAFT_261947 [Aspergillus campestris IBT 28561]